MKSLGLISIVLASLTGSAEAAMFTCQFSAASGGKPLTCTVDSTKITPCRQDFSPTLMALCQGGRSLGSPTTLLRCYFADPGKPPQVQDDAGSDLATAMKNVADQPGVRTTAIEWISTSATDMGLLYSDPSQPGVGLVVFCKANP